MPRSLHLALFLTGLLWLLAANAIALRAADGLAARLNWSVVPEDLLANIFLLLLLLAGFTALNWIGTRQGSVRYANALAKHPTAREEFTRGTAIGWAMALAAVLPLVLIGALHPLFAFTAQAWTTTILSLISLFIGALAIEVAFRGFLFRRLIEAIGPTAATLLLSGIYALLASLRPNAGSLSFFIALIAGVLFSLAYLRTHALWLGWGMRFAWSAATALILGLPIAGVASYAGVIQSDVTGPVWLTGGVFGLDAALFTAAVIFIAMAVVYRATRTYAWDYTHPIIVPGGYPMDIAPPAAHTAMEQAAQSVPAKPTLVQIAPAPNPIQSSNGSEHSSSEPAHRP